MELPDGWPTPVQIAHLTASPGDIVVVRFAWEDVEAEDANDVDRVAEIAAMLKRAVPEGVEVLVLVTQKPVDLAVITPEQADG